MAHSQGTSQMFWALANDQEFYLKRMNAFVALAPVANMAYVLESLKLGVNLMGPAEYIAETNTLYSLFDPDEKSISSIGDAALVLLEFV